MTMHGENITRTAAKLRRFAVKYEKVVGDVPDMAKFRSLMREIDQIHAEVGHYQRTLHAIIYDLTVNHG